MVNWGIDNVFDNKIVSCYNFLNLNYIKKNREFIVLINIVTTENKDKIDLLIVKYINRLFQKHSNNYYCVYF